MLSRFHELHESKLPLASLIEFIRPKRAFLVAHVNGVSVGWGVADVFRLDGIAAVGSAGASSIDLHVTGARRCGVSCFSGASPDRGAEIRCHQTRQWDLVR